MTLTGLIALWLILGFWPLSAGSRLALSLPVLLVFSFMLRREWRASPCRYPLVDGITDDSLPPENFQGAVILTCGDSAALFESETRYRETRQGWYLQVKNAEQLPLLTQRLRRTRPALVSQISILLAIMPERHLSLDDFTQSLRNWQRAVMHSGQGLGGAQPIWFVIWVSPPVSPMQEAPLWFISGNRADMQVHPSGEQALPLAEWANKKQTPGSVNRLSYALWLDSLLDWQSKAIGSFLSERQGNLPALRPCIQGFCMSPISGLVDNLWLQHVASITTLPPRRIDCEGLLPLPELLLSELPRPKGVSQRMVFWRHAGSLGGIALTLMMLTSFINNQRLIRSVGEALALYHRLSGDPPTPKLQAQQYLRADVRQLNNWQRWGEPLSYRMWLYQGRNLVDPVMKALSSWVPPALPMPIIQPIMQAPETVRLNSLSLFDTGKSELKSDATKILVNSLMRIKARPGLLIVISGHTDNTGNPALNQRLSRQRAESVRDWMLDAGDLPESCFAVEGYGESRPVANNDTPEGRALNRRVEIRLVPQAEACQIGGIASESSHENDPLA